MSAENTAISQPLEKGFRTGCSGYERTAALASWASVAVLTPDIVELEPFIDPLLSEGQLDTVFLQVHEWIRANGLWWVTGVDWGVEH